MIPAFLNVGAPELIVILVVALLLFGRRLPEVMRAMGRGITQFKKGLHDDEYDESSKALNESKESDEKDDSRKSSPPGQLSG